MNTQLNFIWCGNPLNPQYKDAAFNGPLSFLKRTQNSDTDITYWCADEHKEAVQQYLDQYCQDNNIQKKITVKSLKENLLTELQNKGFITEEERIKIEALYNKMIEYKDFNVAKELFSPLILLLNGGYFFDTTITVNTEPVDQNDSLPDLTLPEITADFAYSFHDGILLRTYPQLDVYAYATTTAGNDLIKALAFLNVETCAKLYDESIPEIFIDEFNGLPEKNRIFDSKTFDINDELKTQFKQLKFRDVAQRETSPTLFFSRTKLIKPSYYLQSQSDEFINFTYQYSYLVTNPARFIATFYAEQCQKLNFTENTLDGSAVLDIEDPNTIITKYFGKSGWCHTPDKLNILEKILISLKLLLNSAIILTSAVINFVFDHLCLILNKILDFIGLYKGTEDTLNTPILSLYDRITLGFTYYDIPNNERNAAIIRANNLDTPECKV